MKIVIIEDEMLTANDLRKILLDIDFTIEIVAIVPSVEEGIDFFLKKHTIDLIFSDIQLGDGLSFDIFKGIDNHIPIVFCTAYDHYALKAFETAGIDYILKPLHKESVVKALQKYKNFKQQFVEPTQPNLPRYFLETLDIIKQQIQRPQTAILVHQADKIVPLDITKIAVFYIVEGITMAHTFDAKQHVLSQNLDALENLFAPQFFRANRQFLVNRNAIKDVTYFFHRKMVVNLTISFKQSIVVGKLKTTEFQNWLTNY
jgi:DNA-binding LytR/AlgR family response regulator